MARVRSAIPMLSQTTKSLLPQSRLCEISQAIPWSPNYHSETNPHAWRNSDHEVGNFGIYLGNWGERGSVNEAGKRRRRQVHDLQLLKCPAAVVVLCETIGAVLELLRSPAVRPTAPDATGLESRPTHEYWVVRGNEEKCAILIAVRKDTCSALLLLDHQVHADVTYVDRKTKKNICGLSRFLTCNVTFKQTIGHLGNEIVVCGVHGNSYTMKMKPRKAWVQFFDLLHDKIQKYGIQFLAGDFNMSVTQVTVQLRSRGWKVDCVAWYPWMHDTEHLFGQYLGFDSCAIFYIGGTVEVKMTWELGDIDILAAVAEPEVAVEPESEDRVLKVYSNLHTPGRPWKCYRSVKHDEEEKHKDLRAMLRDLLTPSTSPEELQSISRGSTHYAPYLRIKQKPMNTADWLVDGQLPLGAHFPLCAFTNNARARSKEKAKERYWKFKGKGKGKGKGEDID